jgi:hypothetical protein
VHGAIGFTQEYTLHYATRRLWSWRDEFGSEATGRASSAARSRRRARTASGSSSRRRAERRAGTGNLRFDPPPAFAPGEALRAEVRAFLAEHLPKRSITDGVGVWGGYDSDFSRKMGARGWIAMTWPKRYGGHETQRARALRGAGGDARRGRAR